MLGSYLVKCLIQAGISVRVLVYNRQRSEKETRLEGFPIEWVEADVTRPETLTPPFKDTLAVIHTIVIAIEKSDCTYDSINYQGTVDVIEAAKSAGVRHIINLSQLGADPKLPYLFLASKGKTQEYITQSGLDWTAFRPSVIWGPEDEFANTFALLIPINPLISPIVGDENTKFQPIWIEDLVPC